MKDDRFLVLYAAHPTTLPPEPQPQAVTIRIAEPVPELDLSQGLDEMHRFYEEQADALVIALYHALPQGTFDRVALKMFEKKLSLYRGVTNS